MRGEGDEDEEDPQEAVKRKKEEEESGDALVDDWQPISEVKRQELMRQVCSLISLKYEVY